MYLSTISRVAAILYTTTTERSTNHAQQTDRNRSLTCMRHWWRIGSNQSSTLLQELAGGTGGGVFKLDY